MKSALLLLVASVSADTLIPKSDEYPSCMTAPAKQRSIQHLCTASNAALCAHFDHPYVWQITLNPESKCEIRDEDFKKFEYTQHCQTT